MHVETGALGLGGGEISIGLYIHLYTTTGFAH